MEERSQRLEDSDDGKEEEETDLERTDTYIILGENYSMSTNLLAEWRCKETDIDEEKEDTERQKRQAGKE